MAYRNICIILFYCIFSASFFMFFSNTQQQICNTLYKGFRSGSSSSKNTDGLLCIYFVSKATVHLFQANLFYMSRAGKAQLNLGVESLCFAAHSLCQPASLDTNTRCSAKMWLNACAELGTKFYVCFFQFWEVFNINVTETNNRGKKQ